MSSPRAWVLVPCALALALSCRHAPLAVDLRSAGFSDSGQPVCITPTVRAHSPSELHDEGPLLQAAIERLQDLFGNTRPCRDDASGRVEVAVVAEPRQGSGAQLTLTLKAWARQQLLWDQDFRAESPDASHPAVRHALERALVDAERFITLDASAGRVITLLEPALHARVKSWLVEQGFSLEPEDAEALHRVTTTSARTLLTTGGARAAPDDVDGGVVGQLQARFTPVEGRQTLLQVQWLPADGGAGRERATERALLALFDREASLEVLGHRDDEGALDDFVADLAPAPSPGGPTAAQLAKECQVDLREGTRDDFQAGHVLLLPDLEGSRQAPEVLRRAACAGLLLGLAVTVAVGIEADEQPSLNAFLSSDGGTEARRRLLASKWWNRLWQDGRSSQAEFELVDWVRAQRAAKRPITLLAIDAPVPGNPRAAAMSARLMEHLHANPGRLVVASTSNTLAHLTLGVEWDPGFLPLGYRLASAGVPVTPYDARYNAGRRWTCVLMRQGHMKCGTWPLRPAPELADVDLVHGDTVFRREPVGDPPAFLGTVCLGALEPSPPAVPGFKDEARR